MHYREMRTKLQRYTHMNFATDTRLLILLLIDQSDPSRNDVSVMLSSGAKNLQMEPARAITWQTKCVAHAEIMFRA